MLQHAVEIADLNGGHGPISPALERSTNGPREPGPGAGEHEACHPLRGAGVYDSAYRRDGVRPCVGVEDRAHAFHCELPGSEVVRETPSP